MTLYPLPSDWPDDLKQRIAAKVEMGTYGSAVELLERAAEFLLALEEQGEFRAELLRRLDSPDAIGHEELVARLRERRAARAAVR